MTYLPARFGDKKIEEIWLFLNFIWKNWSLREFLKTLFPCFCGFMSHVKSVCGIFTSLEGTVKACCGFIVLNGNKNTHYISVTATPIQVPVYLSTLEQRNSMSCTDIKYLLTCYFLPICWDLSFGESTTTFVRSQ